MWSSILTHLQHWCPCSLSYVVIQPSPGLSHEFLSVQQIYMDLKLSMPALNNFYSERELAFMLNKHSDDFGKNVKSRVNGAPQNGRWLYTAKKDTTIKLDIQFFQHCEAAKGNWENIGYIRKSPTNESIEDRARLLNSQATKLRGLTLCRRVYASPCCKSTSVLVRRDCDDDEVTGMLEDIQGSMQDLLEVVSKPGTMIRLCVIDYAGLTEDPVDLVNFLRAYKQVKEVVVENKGKMVILSRHQLIHGDGSKQFKCRKGPVKRSS